MELGLGVGSIDMSFIRKPPKKFYELQFVHAPKALFLCVFFDKLSLTDFRL
jgi:hypothetical protein